MKGGVEGTGGQRGVNKRPESREGGECRRREARGQQEKRSKRTTGGEERKGRTAHTKLKAVQEFREERRREARR